MNFLWMSHKKLSERGLTVGGGKSQKVGVLQGFLNPAPGRASFLGGDLAGGVVTFWFRSEVHIGLL